MVYDWDRRNTWPKGSLVLGLGVSAVLVLAAFLFLPSPF